MITDPAHPWHTFAGEIVSGPEKFGLGWVGQRIKLDGNHGEAFIRPEQTDWKRKPGRPRVIKVPALPAAIKKLVPKSDMAPSSSSKLIPTETERSNATRLFREIGNECACYRCLFIEIRDLNRRLRAGPWGTYDA